MKQTLKFVMALGVAILVVFAVRAYLFTTYTVQDNIGHVLRRGDKVLVNKWWRAPIQRGDLLVFDVSPAAIGQVVALPGDTITLAGVRYRIPVTCCNRCQCPDCKLYLFDVGTQKTLVFKHRVVGKAYRLW